MRDVLEISRPSIFRDQEISFQLYPAIINNTKYVYDDWWKPVNLVSDQRHIENVRYINNVHKKYNISIENASPDLLKELKNLRQQTKKWRRDVDTVKQRLYKREYRDLLKEKNQLEFVINQKKLREKELENNVIYQQAKKFQNIIEENPDIIEIMKDIDEGKMIDEKNLALTTEKDPEVKKIKEDKPRNKTITEEEKEVENTTPSEPEMSMQEFIAEMNRDSEAISDKAIPAWSDCSLSLLEKVKSLDYMMAKYWDDIDYAIEKIQMKIMKWEAVEDSLRDAKRIQRKINTIENEVREWTKEVNVDARRESIREQDLWESYWLDAETSAERFDELRDRRNITVDQKYHWVKSENDKLKALMKAEETKWYPTGTFIKEVSKLEDLDVIVKISSDKISSLEWQISSAKWKQKTEALIKEKEKWEYLREQTKDRIAEVEDTKYEREWQEAIWYNVWTSSDLCPL